MKRTQVQLFLLLIVFAFTALTFAGTASAGWTWDDGGAAGTTGWTWDDGATSSDSGQ
jgi:hypothetical protein